MGRAKHGRAVQVTWLLVIAFCIGCWLLIIACLIQLWAVLR